jgi:hypothetical protein
LTQKDEEILSEEILSEKSCKESVLIREDTEIQGEEIVEMGEASD